MRRLGPTSRSDGSRFHLGGEPITRYRVPTAGRIEQTQILRDVDVPEVVILEDGSAKVRLRPYPWLVVLNQECDLQLDYLARNRLSGSDGKPPVRLDKRLTNILLCPAFPADHVLAGTYVEEAPAWGGTEKGILLGNRHDRYHVLAPEEPNIEVQLILDFKLVVGATPSYIEQWIATHPDSSVAALEPPFRERLMQRFVNYLGRVAEPDES